MSYDMKICHGTYKYATFHDIVAGGITCHTISLMFLNATNIPVKFNINRINDLDPKLTGKTKKPTNKR